MLSQPSHRKEIPVKTVSVCFAVLMLVGVLVSSPAHALLIGDGYKDSITFRFFEVVEYPTNIGCTLLTLIGGCAFYEVLETSPTGTLTLELFDEWHIANLTPVREYSIPLSLNNSGLGIGSLSDYTIPPDGDGALSITVVGGVLDLQQAWYVENYDGRHFAGYWDALVIPPVPHPVPSPVPEPSTLLLLGSGLAGWGGVVWRGNRKR
jgi:hypothetical protein